MKPKYIESIKNQPESQFIKKIQVFIRFANFYGRFIQNFNVIAGFFTLMFKTSPSSKALKPAKKKIITTL